MTYFITDVSEQVEILTESTANGKELYIEGVFSTFGKKNRNGRRYTQPVLEGAVDRYINEYVNTGRAIGEINHPSTPIPDPRKASILIESLTWKGNDLIGKAKVMKTPEGDILRGLLESGYKTGISSRGTGSIKNVNGVDEVQSDFELFAYDIVHNPSNYGSMVEGLFEGAVWTPMTVSEVVEELDEAALVDIKAMRFEAIQNLFKAL